MNNVIIDTSSWIEFFNKPKSKIGDSVAHLIELDQAVLVGPVLTELLCGIKSKQESEKINSLFEILHYVKVIPSDWVNTGKKMSSLRRKGITIPLTDSLISIIAIRKGYSILTLDKHFDHLSIIKYN